MSQISVRKIYSIVRLILITVVLIYFIGCLFLFGVTTLNSDEDYDSIATGASLDPPVTGNTFDAWFPPDSDNF
jgi:hypothetical protein